MCRKPVLGSPDSSFTFSAVTLAAVLLATIPDMLEAAHIIPDQENGTDDPRNRIVLHHRAFDRGLLRIHPESLEFCVDPAHSAEALHLSRKDLTHLAKRPHPDALRWRWEWQEQKLRN